MAETHSLDRLLVTAGRDSYGIVTRRQLLLEGCSQRQIEHRIKRGTLWPAFRAAYSVGGPPSSWRSLWMAAVLSSGPKAMLAGPAAASLWRLTDARPGAIDVNRPTGNNRTEKSRPGSGWSTELRIWSRSNCPSSPALVDRIPVLPVPDLLIDLAGKSTPVELEGYISSASQKGYLDRPRVTRLIDEGAGRKGIKELRYQLRYWDEEMLNALSILETRFIAVCKKRGIEVPKTNQWVSGLMVDFIWPNLRIVVEVDGFTFHGDRVAFERDHDRAAILMRDGYLRLAFTWRQVIETPDEVVATVLAAMATWRG